MARPKCKNSVDYVASTVFSIFTNPAWFAATGSEFILPERFRSISAWEGSEEKLLFLGLLYDG